MHDRVVVGAGISGLAYAWWAARRGEDVVLLEEGDRVGGVVRTDVRDGFRFERAASTIPSTAKNLLALVGSLPSPPRLVPAHEAAKRQFLLRRRGLEAVPRSPPSLLRTPLLTGGGKVRVFAEMLRGPRRVTRSETLHDFVRRRFGRQVADTFLRPFTKGVYGADPARLGAADAFPTLVAMERRRGSVLRALVAGGSRKSGGARRHVLVAAEGTESVPRAIAAGLGERVRLRAGVTAIRPQEGHVLVEGAGGTVLRTREVALAVPAWRQGELVSPLSSTVAEVLGNVTYVPIVVAGVGLRRDRGPAVPDGFGFLRAPGSSARILGATFLSRLHPAIAPEGSDLLNVYLGGTEDPGVIDLSDTDVRDVVLRDLALALGGRVDPVVVDLRRWPRAIPLFAPGHRGRMARASADLAAFGVRLLGSHVTGVGLDACCSAGAPVLGELPAGLQHVA